MIAVQLISRGIEIHPWVTVQGIKFCLLEISSSCIEMLIESNSSENWKDIREVWPWKMRVACHRVSWDCTKKKMEVNRGAYSADYL